MSHLHVEIRPDPDRGSVPVRFGPAGAHAAEVESVVDCWPGDDHRYFRVRVHDGAEFILRQDLTTGLWRLDFFRRSDETDAPD